MNTNEHALNTPFGKDSLFYTAKTGDFFEGNVDFKKVLQKIGAVISDYDNEEIPTGNQLKEVIIEAEIVKKPFNYLEYSNTDSSIANYWQHQKNNFSGQAILNKKIGYLDPEKIFLSKNGSGAQRYFLYIPYTNDGNVSLNNPNIEYLEKNAAVKLKFLGIDGLITIFSFFAASKRKSYLENIYKDIAREIERSILTDPFALSIISEFPLDLLKYFKSATVETILFTILKDIVNNDKEKVLLKLFKVLYLNNDFNPDLFLNKLLTIKIGKQSAFVTLYEKMNDWGGENNFSKVIIELTKIWLLSSYSDSNNKIYKNYAPAPNLIYDQKIILGFRKDDFSFTFEENNDIMIVKSEFGGLEIPGLSTYNRYHPLQPMPVIDLKEKSNEDLVLEEGVPIPLFYLKAFDDKAAWENFEKTTWLILDIVSTFTGVGNLTKLKYLVKGSKLFYLKTVFGIIQVLSSVASIGLALIENSKNKELVNKIRSYLFWVEICTLGADVLSTKILTQKAGEARTVLAEYRQTVKNKKKLEEIDEFAEHLDEVIKKTGLLPVKIVTGRYSKRIFDINNCGGEILNLTWHDAKITNEGIEIIKKHLSRFEDIAANRKMIRRLEQIKSGKLEITDWDKRFFTHETREFNRYKSLGYENSLQKEIPDEIYENAHSATLEDFKLNEIQNDGKRTLYHPEIEDIEFYSDEERKLLGL